MGVECVRLFIGGQLICKAIGDGEWRGRAEGRPSCVAVQQLEAGGSSMGEAMR